MGLRLAILERSTLLNEDSGWLTLAAQRRRRFRRARTPRAQSFAARSPDSALQLCPRWVNKRTVSPSRRTTRRWRRASRGAPAHARLVGRRSVRRSSGKSGSDPASTQRLVVTGTFFYSPYRRCRRVRSLPRRSKSSAMRANRSASLLCTKFEISRWPELASSAYLSASFR